MRVKRKDGNGCPHIPGGRVKPHGRTHVEVVCSDHKRHEYLNVGVPESSLPSPQYVACSECGKAMSELIGHESGMCSFCRWETFLADSDDFATQEGISLKDICPGTNLRSFHKGGGFRRMDVKGLSRRQFDSSNEGKGGKQGWSRLMKNG
jgi:hypothetical protein